MDDGKESEQQQQQKLRKGRLKQLDLRRCDDLFMWLGNYAHVRVMLGSSVNYLQTLFEEAGKDQKLCP